jgi:hypothetical protein
MADYKVTDLNEILATSVASDDLALLVDISASEDKKIKVEELSKAIATNLPTNTVNGDRLANDTVTATQIAAAAITSSELADNSVQRNHVVAGEISGSATARGKVHIEAGSINATDIASGSITNTQLSGGTLIPTGGLTDSEVSASADIQLSKLEDASPNTVLAGPSTGVVAGNVTARALVSADLPVATTTDAGAVSVPASNGLNLAGGVLTHTDTVTAADLGWVAFNGTGHITSARALTAADLPIATTSSLGVVSIGSGLSITGGGALSLDAATVSSVGGIVVGTEFILGGSSDLQLATSGVTAGDYPKVTVNSKGIVTAGTTLIDTDIPNHSASLLTSGTLDVAVIASNTITGDKLADASTCVIQSTTPAFGAYEGQFFLNSSSNVLTVWNGSAFVAVSAAAAIDDGTY